MMPAARREKRRRKHSLGGCRTCRRRHVKCDQIKPHCLACQSLDLACDGYDSDLRWMPPVTLVSTGEAQLEDESDGANTTRHHLFPIALRASMSASLRESLGSISVDVFLAQLEAQAHNLQANEGSVSFGPFGVLEMDTVPSEANQTVYVASDNTSNQGQLTEFSREASLLGATSYSANMYASIPNLSKTLQWPDLFTLGLNSGDGFQSPKHTTTIPQQRPENLMFGNELTQDGNVANWLSMCSTQELDEMHLPEISTFAAGPDRRMIALVEVDSVAEAQLLLKHFHDSVISLMNLIPPKAKSYWIRLQFAEAVRVLSELSYLRTGKVTHASAANFYGILACSAYHLSNIPMVRTTKEPEYWMNLFTRLKHQASIHIQVSVHEEQNCPRKASYKDQLMAFLTLVACNTISGNYTAARCYISDSERLIQSKSLKGQRTSKDCRALHQVYAWIRIMGESTFVDMDHAQYITNMIVADSIPDSETAMEPFLDADQSTGLDKFLGLDLYQIDSDADEDEPEARDFSPPESHPNYSPQHVHTTPNEIHGIPETWLSLISQTTRLANIQDAAKSTEDTDPKFLHLLRERASNLEQYIYDWVSNDSDEVLRSRQLANRHMLQAMNSALIILFYRRVRNIDASSLQKHVDSVLAALFKFDAALASEGSVGPGSPWPAFVAGCEAADHRNRTLLMTWLDRGFDKSGLKPFDTALEVMREVWDRRDGKVKVGSAGFGGSGRGEAAESPSCRHTWVSVCREKGVWVPLY